MFTNQCSPMFALWLLLGNFLLLSSCFLLFFSLIVPDLPTFCADSSQFVFSLFKCGLINGLLLYLPLPVSLFGERLRLLWVRVVESTVWIRFARNASSVSFNLTYRRYRAYSSERSPTGESSRNGHAFWKRDELPTTTNSSPQFPIV